MMRLPCLTLLLAASSALFACTGAGTGPDLSQVTAPAPAIVPHSQQWTMHSKASGRDYEIFVAAPDGPVPEEGYTTIYVLDGNHMFLTTVETVRAYARRRDADASARALVVGIGYPEGVASARARVLDLTPEIQDPAQPHPYGGADAFLQFIVHELKPEIARRFPPNPARQALIGHSLGGRFTLDAMTRAPDAFTTYVGMSASFWYGGHDLVRRIDDFVSARGNGEVPASPLRVLLTAGEYEQVPRPEDWLRDPTRAARRAEVLQARGQHPHSLHAVSTLSALPGVEAEFQDIAGEDHGSVIPAAIGRAVRFILVIPAAQ